MIRPEARDAIYQWREVIMGVGIAALGAYWVVNYFGLLKGIGFLLVLLGIAITYVGVQRARFRQNSEGPGIVTVVEGEISYFGPLSGGAVSIEDIEQITLRTSMGQRSWHIKRAAETPIDIPTNARGAEALFDVFTMLPKLNIEFMVKKLSQKDDKDVLIWQKDTYLETKRYLH